MHISYINGKEIFYKDDGIEMDGFFISYDDMSDIEVSEDLFSFTFNGGSFNIPHNLEEQGIISDIVFASEKSNDDIIIDEFEEFFKDIPDATDKSNIDYEAEETSVYDRKMQQDIEMQQRKIDEQRRKDEEARNNSEYFEMKNSTAENNLPDKNSEKFMKPSELGYTPTIIQDEQPKKKGKKKKKKGNTLAIILASVLGAIGIGILGAMLLSGNF